jgi:glycerol-3-phosphate responsive antiterminator
MMRRSTILKNPKEHFRNARSNDLNIRHIHRIYLFGTSISFGYLREKLKLLAYKTVEELEGVITGAIEIIPKATLIAVIRSWRQSLDQCGIMEKNPVFWRRQRHRIL